MKEASKFALFEKVNELAEAPDLEHRKKRKPNLIMILLLMAQLVACGMNPYQRLDGSGAEKEAYEETSDLLSRSAGSHIKYFGYYGSAMSWVGSGNYIKPTSDHANVAWIADCGREVAKLKELESARMFAVIDVSCYFLNSNFQLLPQAEYQSKWQDFVNRVKPHRANIIAFYPLDEPFLNGPQRGVSIATMTQQLTTINSVIKQSFPQKATAVIFAAKELYTGGVQIPANYDWVGFNCYGDWNQCYQKKSIPEIFQQMTALMKPHQKAFLVPDANAQGYPSNDQQVKITERAYLYYDLAKRDGRIIGLFPFIFQSFNDGHGPYTGVMDMPIALPAYKAIGRSIARANPSCFPLSFRGGSLSKTKLLPGEEFFLNCDYGQIVDSIIPQIQNTKCVGVAFVGTSAKFRCKAPSTAGKVAANCSLVAGTNSRTCPLTNQIGTLTIQ